ncbi:MAG: glucose-6-phosphate dehydrogenase assembly protein OpcA [Opitutales bacterium]
MNDLFNKIPGIQMPVPEVRRQLAAMWREEDGHGENSPSNAHALQMNLVIHFGLKTSVEEAEGVFGVAIEFSQRYPCRIIVLCPEEPTGEEIGLEAKLFSQCYLGGGGNERCCCEALILGYGTNEAIFLEHQLSVWLASDLPVYHWLHRVPVDRVVKYYLDDLLKSRRIVFDSAIDGDDYYEINWSRSEMLSDLANARTARLRQSLGQFLSAIPPSTLVDNLREVSVSTTPSSKAEAQRLLEWQQTKLQGCSQRTDIKLTAAIFHLVDLPETSENSLESNWIYENGNSLSWKLPANGNLAQVHAIFENQTCARVVRADPFPPTKALSEALFF